MRQPDRSALVGRGAELAALSAILDEVVVGPRCALVAVTGEAGIGKSRLLEQFSHAASDAGARVVWGSCWEASAAPAFWPWVQVFRACRGELPGESWARVEALLAGGELAAGTVEDPQEARFRVFEAALEAVESVLERGPLVVAIEDVHAADRPSMMLLSFLAGHVHRLPLLLLVSYRDGGAGIDRGARPDGLENVGYRFRLGGLGLEDLGLVISATLGREPSHALVTRVHGLSGGNPLFAHELARSFVRAGERPDREFDAELPANVHEVVSQRLRTFSADAQQVAEIAAVIGRDFQPKLLKATASAQAVDLGGALDELIEADLIAALPGEPDGYRFSHTVLRDAIYESVPPGRRSELHRMVGRALEAADVRELRRNAPLVAHHFAFAGSRPDLVRAIELWTLAGGWARSQAAFESAAEHWRAALLLMERTGATFEEHARLLERYGQLLCVTGIDHRSGVAALEQAMGLYAEAGLAHRRAAVHAKLGVALSTFPEFFELRAALRHFRAAEELLDGTGDDQRLARVQLGSAAVAIQQLAPGPGAEAAARCLDLAERLGDDGLWATAAAVAAFHAGAEGRLTDMFELIERAHIAADRGLSASGRFTATWLESTIWFALGNPRQLLTAVGPRLDQFAQAPARSATMHEFLAHAYALSGRVDEATIELAAVDRQQYFGGPSVDFAAGDWSAAKSTLQQLLTRDRLAGNRAFECFGYLLLVRIQRAQREFEEAARLLNQCLELALGGPNRLVESWCRSELALVLACAGRSEESRTEIRHCRELLDDSCWIARTVAVDLAEAIITSQLGRSADAQVLADRAFSTCEHVGLPFDEADARQLWADCLRANGDEFSAQRAESRAAAILEAIQAGGSWTGLRALGNRQPAGRDVFVREGEYWTVQFAGTTARVKHVKGLSFIAELLHHPGEEIHALELVAAVEGHAGTPATASLRGDAGPALDSQAKREYRQRLSELAQDLSEAETFHDLGRTAKIQAEIDAITDELTRALGLGGRDRRVASASERARVSVTKRITAAVSRLEEAHPALGNHFASTLRTGSYCSYQPDSRLRTNWQT